MKIIRAPRALGVFLSLLLLSLRATAEAMPERSPADVAFNREAGRGGWLIVTLRLDGGEELSFIVDTGSPITLIDKSLEPRLGKRLETMTFSSPAGGEQESGVYAAPGLYLGGARLITDAFIASYTCKQLSALSRKRIMGVLGMDCLRHYCTQLDFQAGKMRFLTADQVNAAELGPAFPLRFTTQRQNFPPMFAGAGQNDGVPFIQHVGLLGGTGANLLIDTGDNVDGVVEKSAIEGHYATRIAHFLARFRALRLPQCVWAGQTYTELRVNPAKNSNQLGLRFLARHLVTLDFPNRTVYLRQKSIGPLDIREKQ